MSTNSPARFTNIAISLHWLMAFLIIGMLVIGKFMVSLDETNPIRFTLTQWHKTFGVLILLLTVLRLLWRLTHKAPQHPEAAPAWEHYAAKASHVLFYLLLFIAPITGWMLVSVSPLNIDTLLFNVIPWPHLPWLHNIADKASAVHLYEQIHEIATGVLIVLLLLHVGAALKHHLIDKDDVLNRMLLSQNSGALKTFILLIFGVAIASAAAVFGYGALQPKSTPLAAGSSQVMATAIVSAEETVITFASSNVTANIDTAVPANSSIVATVDTASADSSNYQVTGSLPDADWFDSENHPEARFESSSVRQDTDGNLIVTGALTIKGNSVEHTFPMQISPNENGSGNTAKGSFPVSRTSYKLGLESQPNMDYVADEVIISFTFELKDAE